MMSGSSHESAFAQPSGLALDGDRLYVADCETSSIRAVGLSENAQVQTVCGSGGLFEFGDRDGTGDDARLQHCLGVTLGDGVLYVADTYNHSIKRVRLPHGTCDTILKSGLWEPSGVSWAETRLYIADRNHHAVRSLDLNTGAVTTLPFAELCAPVCVP